MAVSVIIYWGLSVALAVLAVWALIMTFVYFTKQVGGNLFMLVVIDLLAGLVGLAGWVVYSNTSWSNYWLTASPKTTSSLLLISWIALLVLAVVQFVLTVVDAKRVAA
ncbi:hypothetical protein EQG49_08130 [Periweissella cryptocerci]|uniref:Uncharacterized protein n=1 Tax=Periweissella cryptocerci TaxID=2506420 RepID=A0A4P6YUR5_9LACO|nr:hypothetical protein [Periweissella cryptocerci]QBO36437.1 hypothetical protein EQG49_08130 [Periweissella cryptocerci]